MKSHLIILLLEDEPGSVHLAQLMFAEVLPQVQLFVVADGLEGLAFLRREGDYATMPRPDLIVSDMFMPRMDGLQFLRQIKQDSLLCAIPVLMFSSTLEEAQIMESYRCFAAGYIVKPLDIGRYLEVLQGLATYWMQTVCLPQQDSRL